MAGLARKRVLHRASRCCCIAQAPVTCLIKACLLLSAYSAGDMSHTYETSGIHEISRHVTITVNSPISVTSYVSGTPARAAGLGCRTPAALGLAPGLHCPARPGCPPQQPLPQTPSTERSTSAGRQPLQQVKNCGDIHAQLPFLCACHLQGKMRSASSLHADLCGQQPRLSAVCGCNWHHAASWSLARRWQLAGRRCCRCLP